MTILERIDTDFVNAMKQKEEVRLSTLRLARAALKNKQIDLGQTLTDAEATTVLASMIKQYKDALDDFSRAGREDLIDRQRQEIDILITYLPPEMSDEELEKIVKDVIEESRAKDFGKAMGAAMKSVAGRADGARVRKIVQQLLGTS